MNINHVAKALEEWAPLSYQESYDNSGLQIGDRHRTVTGVLVSLDVTEAVIEEAAANGCNLVVAHHPVLFTGLKRITGSTYTERIVLKAIQQNVAIYAIHTNFDNVRNGVNASIASRLGLESTTILEPKADTFQKLHTYVPEHHADHVLNALFSAGAGAIGNYSECGFLHPGKGTFRPGKQANPHIGLAGGPREVVPEIKIEVLINRRDAQPVITALKRAHPYETVAYDLVDVGQANMDVGAGLIGVLSEALPEARFLMFLKERMHVSVVRHTALRGRPVRKVAVCGGAGSFLLASAIRQQADAFVSADFKYHQFFDADGQILVADIGHFESEQFAVSLIGNYLRDYFPSFAVLLSNLNTNPVQYFF